MAGWDQFLAVVLPSVIIGAVWWFLYVLLRQRETKIYAPRTVMLSGDRRARPLPAGAFGWLRGVLAIEESEIIQRVGLDPIVFLRFLKIGLQLFGLGLIWFAILIPVHIHGDNEAEGIDQSAMSNLEQKSPALWAHLVALYFMSIAFYYIVAKNYKQIVALAQDFKSKPRPQQYTVLVSNIPVSHRSQEKLSAFFQDLFPSSFHSAYLVHDFTELDEKVAEYTDTVRSLEHTRAAFEQDKATKPETERPTTRTKMCIGDKVDALDFYSQKALDLKEQILAFRADHSKHIPSSVGFVSFRNLSAAAAAAQARLAVDPKVWHARIAPEPREMYWPNLYKPKPEINAPIIKVLTVALILFWAIPISFISSLTSLESLSESLPFLDPIVDSNAALKGFLQGFLPTLAIIVFMALLPTILRAMTVFRGAQSESEIQRDVLAKYYYFQVFNVFLITTISGTIFQSISEIISDVTLIPQLLAEALPKNALFFINIVILTGFASFAAEICRFVPLLIAKIKGKFLAKTALEKEEVYNPGPLDYSVVMPALLLDFVLVISYFSIAPIIIPFGVIFFALGYIVYKHQFAYVYMPKFESAGSMWPQVFAYMVAGLFISQLTVITIVALKYGAVQAPLMMPLLVATIVFYGRYQRQYRELLESPNVALTVARASDSAVRLDDSMLAELQRAYVAPGMTADLDHILEPDASDQARAQERFALQLAMASAAAVQSSLAKAGEGQNGSDHAGVDGANAAAGGVREPKGVLLGGDSEVHLDLGNVADEENRRFLNGGHGDRGESTDALHPLVGSGSGPNTPANAIIIVKPENTTH